MFVMTVLPGLDAGTVPEVSFSNFEAPAPLSCDDFVPFTSTTHTIECVEPEEFMLGLVFTPKGTKEPLQFWQNLCWTGEATLIDRLFEGNPEQCVRVIVNVGI
jgi:hypothetical protein